jgi:hypothetical protein
MKVYLSVFIILVIACSISAQEADKIAAAAIDKRLHHCEDLGTVIESERKRLGVRFETELLTYLGTDVDKHYWIACAVSGCSKQDDRALESLSLLIKLQALSLLEGKKDDDSLYAAVALHVISAVQSQHLGFQSMAITQKSQAESLVSRRPILKGGFPAMSKDDWTIYDSLPRQPLNSAKARNRTFKNNSKK